MTPRGALEESRLARMIARLQTQRACLEHAARLVQGLDGPVLEIGLGKGRTYDHLRRLLPEREIFVFDKDVHAPADSVPDAGHLMLGDIRRSLPQFARRIGPTAALVHADIGTEDRMADAPLQAELALALPDVLRPGGVLVADRDMAPDNWPRLPLPDGADGWPYYMYRAPGGAGAA